MKNKEILNIARLMRIPLEPAQEMEILEQFGNILQYMTQLEEVNTHNIPPTLHPVENSIACNYEKTTSIKTTDLHKKENFFIVPNLFIDV